MADSAAYEDLQLADSRRLGSHCIGYMANAGAPGVA